MISSEVPSNQPSFLATDPDLPSASSYFLHTPLPSVGEFNINISGSDIGEVSQASAPNDIVSEKGGNLGTENNDCLATETSGSQARPTEPGNKFVNPPLPLLLNPELMKGTGICIVSPVGQVSYLFLTWNGILVCSEWSLSCIARNPLN